ncbi:MAG: hypothetical protein M3R63_06110 [Actinomycetota bacterium]|nr:hypothetical protein [Actinomycetota bacterium]
MSQPGLDEWLALGSVASGGIAKSAGIYSDHGRPMPDHLTEVLDRLTWSGLLRVADGDLLWDLRRISFTEAGQARYLALCQQRQRAQLEVPAPEFGTTSTQGPVSRQWSDSCPPVPGDRPDSTL